MIAWLYKLLVGDFHQCKHEWKVIHEQGYVNSFGGFTRRIYVLQCKNCGDIKQETIN